MLLYWLFGNGLAGVGFSFTYLLQRIAADKREAHISFTLCSCCWRAGLPSGEVFCRMASPLVIIIFIWISFSCFTDNRAYKSKYRSPLSFACLAFLAWNVSGLLKIVEWCALSHASLGLMVAGGRITCWRVSATNPQSPSSLQVALAF